MYLSSFPFNPISLGIGWKWSMIKRLFYVHIRCHMTCTYTCRWKHKDRETAYCPQRRVSEGEQRHGNIRGSSIGEKTTTTNWRGNQTRRRSCNEGHKWMGPILINNHTSYLLHLLVLWQRSRSGLSSQQTSWSRAYCQQAHDVRSRLSCWRHCFTRCQRHCREQPW